MSQGLTGSKNTPALSGQVTSGQIGNSAVVSGSIGSGQIGPRHIASGAIQSGHIASGNTIPDPVFTGFVDFVEIAAPATPSSGTVREYGNLYKGIPSVAVKNDSGLTIQLSRDNIIACKNITGGSLPAGTAVYITGSSGNTPTVGKAKSDSDTTMPCVGIVMSSIANGATGAVMFTGILTGVDTSAFVEGDFLYVSETTAGALTNVAPTLPNEAQRVAICLLSDVSAGQLQVILGSINSGGGATLSSGSVTSGMVGIGAITSGNIASGAIGSMQIMSGAQITIAARVIDFLGYVTSEPISGGLAVGLNKSGLAQVAMASIPSRMPAFGVCEANVSSGIAINPLIYGRTTLPSVNFSGNTGQPIWVGASGLIVSFAPNSSGFIQQKMGLAISSSGANVIPDQDFFQVQA